MIVFEVDQVVTIDCDDTLVMWPDSHKKREGITHNQPYEGALGIPDPYDNSVNYLVPHQKHVDLVKKYKGRGFVVIVWSAAGVKWAHSVVNALGLEPYVDLVLTKPSRYVDDTIAEKWMGNRVYIPFDD